MIKVDQQFADLTRKCLQIFIDYAIQVTEWVHTHSGLVSRKMLNTWNVVDNINQININKPSRKSDLKNIRDIAFKFLERLG